jgi:hypothetical protein
MIQRWSRKLKAIAVVMFLAYVMRTGIGACHVLGVLMCSKFMQ